MKLGFDTKTSNTRRMLQALGLHGLDYMRRKGGLMLEHWLGASSPILTVVDSNKVFEPRSSKVRASRRRRCFWGGWIMGCFASRY